MKKAWLVYYGDKSANVVICEDIKDIPIVIGEKKFSQVVKIDLIPFEVL